MYFEVNLLFFFTALYTDHANGQASIIDEFKDLNNSCYPIVNCIQVKTRDNSPGVSTIKPCSCHKLCSQFDTCCLDAPSRQSDQAKVKSVCRRVKLSENYSKSFYMVDRCSSGNDYISIWEELCNDDRKAEGGDLMRLVPVTSLITSTTYKNYFCLRCHEETDDFAYWNLQLRSDASQELEPNMKHDKLVYSRQNKTWLVRLEKSQTWLPVDLYLQIPSEIDPLQNECMPDIISQCSNSWPDGPVSRKCHSYTSVIRIWRNRQMFKYRNPHCAACNYKDLSKTPCERDHAKEDSRRTFKYDDIRDRYAGDSSRDGYSGNSSRHKYADNSRRDRYPIDSSRHRFRDSSAIRDRHRNGYDETLDEIRPRKILFSFTYLLDITRSDGDKVGKLKMCEDNDLWDPWANTCRELSCAIPEYTLQGRKCVPP